MKNFLLLFTPLFFFVPTGPGFTGTATAQQSSGQQQFYQIKIYSLDDRNQEQQVDRYLKESYLPVLHRAGIEPVGVFKPAGQDTASSDLRTYVFIPFESLDQLTALPSMLDNDSRYLNDGASYIHASYNQPPYSFIESIILKAFSHAPSVQKPGLKTPRSQRIYELRSYGSATEALNENKVAMFNEGGEVRIFDRLGFNAVFYGQVLSGSEMPNLMYMTTFEDMKSRDAHWESFRNDPEWGELSSMEKYRNNVSRIDIQFLRPTEYSDL